LLYRCIDYGRPVLFAKVGLSAAPPPNEKKGMGLFVIGAGSSHNPCRHGDESMDDVLVLFCLSLAVPLFCGVAGMVVAFIDRKQHRSTVASIGKRLRKELDPT
jgi:hypothetical protein